MCSDRKYLADVIKIFAVLNASRCSHEFSVNSYYVPLVTPLITCATCRPTDRNEFLMIIDFGVFVYVAN